jgi:PAS domain S-box-containing protein
MSPEAILNPAETTQESAKILLVDDSAENLISLEAALEGLGQQLVLARSGMEALRHLLEHDFAAILLDVKMPEMDGFQTAELIRARKRSRHTPILFLTGYKSDDHLFRGYDLGAVDFLFKPIVPEILRSKVMVFVELSRNTALLERQAAALRKTGQEFRSLLDAAPDAMIISAADGRITRVNSQVETMFGYRRDELIGEDVRAVVPGWSAPFDPRPEHSSATAHFHTELQARRKDHCEFPAEINLSPLQTEEGLLIISAVRDITRRKKAEEEVRELNTTLEHRVAERTSELRKSNEALRRSNEDLNQFAYAASHDLQEPLRMVSIYSQMLAKQLGSDLSPEANRSISFIVSGAERMEMLLKDLLSYSQVGSASMGPVDTVNCLAVLQEVLYNLDASIQQSAAQITWDDLPTIPMNRTRLVQLFQNLIGNAIKYRRAEPPKIHISAESQADHWRFTVSDNGIGIKPEYSQQVFGVFKRLHGREYPGTGIGLAICQRIVERYGGRIWVESIPGQGSSFSFTLPLISVQTEGHLELQNADHHAA